MINEKIFELEKTITPIVSANTISTTKNIIPIVSELFEEQILPWICEEFNAESFESFYSTGSGLAFPNIHRHTIKLDGNENFGMVIQLTTVGESTLATSTTNWNGGLIRAIQLGVGYFTDSQTTNNLLTTYQVSSSSSYPYDDWIHIEQVSGGSAPVYKVKVTIRCRILSNDKGAKVLQIAGKNAQFDALSSNTYVNIIVFEDCFGRKYLWTPNATNNLRRLDNDNLTADTIYDPTVSATITGNEVGVVASNVYSSSACATIRGLKSAYIPFTLNRWCKVLFNGKEHIRINDGRFYIEV